jgi:molecular chaperone DnaK (HSP70)
VKIADYIVEAVKKQHNGLDLSITANPRAYARILKEAKKVKEVLSANPETRINVSAINAFRSTHSMNTDREFDS